jgi:hypothetical protein
MRTRVLAMAAAAAVLAACGNDTCPTAAGTPKTGQSPSCTAPAPQQVQVTLQMCEACSHTAPRCNAQLNDLAAKNIFLDTSWEVCTDNTSCSAQACGNAVCQFSVPNDTYTVHVLSGGGTATFQLQVNGATATCTGGI